MVNYKLQEMNDLKNSGKHIVYPKAIANRTLSTDELVQKMQEYNMGVPANVAKSVLGGVAHMMEYMLEMGFNVKLDGIGTFSLSVGFDDEKTNEMESDKDKMLYRKVSVKDVCYKADPKLVKTLKKKVDLDRKESEVSKITQTQYSPDERINRALSIIDKYGFISLTDYAYVNGISRTKASRELKAITAREDSPITSCGNGSHKIWVKAKK